MWNCDVLYLPLHSNSHLIRLIKMTAGNKGNGLSIGSGGHAEILRQRVAVIEHALTETARHFNGRLSADCAERGITESPC